MGLRRRVLDILVGSRTIENMLRRIDHLETENANLKRQVAFWDQRMGETEADIVRIRTRQANDHDLGQRVKLLEIGRRLTINRRW